MSELEATDFQVRRIVVAVDELGSAPAALETATALAAQLRAEVEGVFIEDVDLINAARLALGREYSLVSAEIRRIDVVAVETSLRAEATRVRRTLESLGRRTRVATRFRVARGRLETEIVAAAGDADLLVVTLFGRSVSRRHPGPAALAAASRAPRSVLLVRERPPALRAALVPFDATPAARAARRGASRLVGREGHITLLVAEDDAAARAEAEALSGSGPSPAGALPAPAATILTVPALALDTLCRIAAETGSDVVALGAESTLLAGAGHAALLELLLCPVLLVR